MWVEDVVLEPPYYYYLGDITFSNLYY